MRVYELKMTDTEIKPITVEVEDLQELETVSSASVTHFPPSGSALTITPSISNPFINMLFGPFAVFGFHHVKVQAIGSNGSKPEVMYQIEVINT